MGLPGSRLPGDGEDCSTGDFNSCSPPLPEEGRERVALLLPPAFGSVVPNHSQKEQFPKSLGFSTRVQFVSDALPPQIQTQSMSSPTPWEPGVTPPRSLHRLPFRMLTAKRIFSCIRHQDWFAAINLKDAYFHVSILPRPFLRFAFEGSGISVQSPPLRASSVSPCLFQGHGGDLVLQHLSHLGFQVNQEKSTLSPVQSVSFLGMELDSVNMSARLTNERTQSVLSCLNLFRHRIAVPFKLFQRLLGHMAAAVTLLGLLHMRPLQRWLYGRIPRWAWHRGTFRVGVTLECRRLFSPWSDPAFLRAGVPLGQVSRHVVMNTDASKTGWGAICNGQTASGSWSGPRLQWHINCLELLAVLLALRRFLPTLRDKHVLIRTDNVLTVAYINRQGGLHSRRMSQLAHHLLLWSQIAAGRSHSGRTESYSRCAFTTARPAWRMATPPPGGPANLESIRRGSGGPVRLPGILPLPAVLCPVRGPPRQGRAGTQLAPGTHQVRLSSEPPCTNTVQGQGVRGAGLVGCALLAHPDLVCQPHAPRDSPSLEDSPEEGSSFSGDGHNLAPASRPLEPPCVASGRDPADLTGLPQAVINTITQAKAPSTRQAYALKWGLFADLCSSHREDPQRCSVGVVLSFLQDKLEQKLSPFTLKVYVAAIAAYHDALDGLYLGKHHLIVRFLRGARRLNPPRLHLISSWDFSVVLLGLRRAPFEPLASVEKYLSLKTSLLIALMSIKRVGDLHASSVSESCLEFGPADSHVTLRPRPGYVPKVPTTPFRDQVVSLQALPSEEADPALLLLCPVRALRTYVDRTQSFRRSLFASEGSRWGMLSPSRGWLIGWLMPSPWLTSVRVSRAPWEFEPTPPGVSPPPMRWHTAPL
ncbi:enzymatic polyprotein [Labeo rohita]|uniref:Enzymatic polyprotein n=1 Tax=Labeo rohita TaxID=84645 RepID=A0ABQ8LB32_LABRO|nr:enzymatic polyprotein [Labeo rohita]